MGKLQSYGALESAVDQTSPELERFAQNLDEWVSERQKELVFFELEINHCSLEERDYQDTPSLAVYKPWISVVQGFRPHQLSAELEQLMQDYEGPARQGWIRLYDESLANLRVESQGGESMTLAQALDNLSSPKAEVREGLAKALSHSLMRQESLWVRIYNILIKDHGIQTQWRKFSSPSASLHLRNQIDEEMVNTLVTVVQSSYGSIGHRYYKLKARIMGLSHLKFWDRNAPVFHQESRQEKHYSWEEAQELVLEAYGDFSEEFRDIGKMFFDKNWIHARPSPGKDSGAFSHPTVPSAHPYILMNFYGKSRDVMTLAHELGHGIHQWLSRKQRYFMTDTPLTIAETASVFGERLVFEKLIKKCRSVQEKQILLCQKIEDMLNTVMRQVGFYQFELKVHKRRQEGELSASCLGDLWMETQREVLGEAFILDKDYSIYWAYVSHFMHSPFYVYSYAFGECLVNTLYSQYTKGENGFKSAYTSFLEKGGSEPCESMLKPFGLDSRKPEFWYAGVAPIGHMIDELEASLYGG